MFWKSVISTFLFTLVLFNKHSNILALDNKSNVAINWCSDFHWDSALTKNTTTIKIPGHLTEDGKPTEFWLPENHLNMNCSDILTVTMNLQKKDTLDKANKTGNDTIPTATKYPILSPLPKGYKLRGAIYDHFTKNGSLMFDSTYYDVNNYCVSNFTDSSAIVRICKNKCSSTENRKKVSCVKIPKCCGLGQELVYWNFTCKSSEKHIWTPYIYISPHEKATDTIFLQYSRPLLKCKRWEPWPLIKVQRPKKNNKPSDPKLVWRLLKDGSIVYLNIQREWVPLPKGDFCIDGFANWGLGGDGHYSGLEKDQVILLCPQEMPQDQNTTIMTSSVPYSYASFLFVSSIFLLLTAIVHIALIDKLPVHGLTVLMHSISMFLMYIFLGMAYFTSAKAIDNADDEVKRGSAICIAIGICAHFFFLSTFSWLTIKNFDLWWTFRVVKPLGRIGKRMKRFRIYSGVGWGVPIAAISTFVGLDFTYRDIESEVPVPDYGVKSCFVACYARGRYIYYILAFLISVNLLFIISTCITFIRFQRNNKGLSSKKTTKCDKYSSFKLFAKLFFIMGVAWCFELYSWIQNPCNYNASWHIIILDFIMFLQAMGNFVIFCCNERMVALAEEKFPKYKNALRPIKKLFCLKSSTTSGDGYDMGTHASGSTLRKMSTTISQSLQTE